MNITNNIKVAAKYKLKKMYIRPSRFGWARGSDVFADLKLSCPCSHFETIFDVGAYKGNVALEFARSFQHSKVYAFEPSPKSFQRLAKRRCKQLIPINLALSSSLTPAAKFIDVGGTSNRFIAQSEDSFMGDSVCSVRVDTLDDFCRAKKIDKIDFLKIDTEGHELDVLDGGKSLLKDGRISFIKMEAGVGHDNDRHVPLSKLVEYLCEYRYRVFGFYDQENEFFDRKPNLRRCDIVFIHENEIEKNSGKSRRAPLSLFDIWVRMTNKFNLQ